MEEEYSICEEFADLVRSGECTLMAQMFDRDWSPYEDINDVFFMLGEPFSELTILQEGDTYYQEGVKTFKLSNPEMMGCFYAFKK